jgi:hypothetical protein
MGCVKYVDNASLTSDREEAPTDVDAGGGAYRPR